MKSLNYVDKAAGLGARFPADAQNSHARGKGRRGSGTHRFVVEQEANRQPPRANRAPPLSLSLSLSLARSLALVAVSTGKPPENINAQQLNAGFRQRVLAAT